MGKLAIVYWSGTGNTQAMAEAVLAGAQEAGAEAQLYTSAEFDASALAGLDAVVFGCPAMGSEVLEEDEFAPLFDACKPALQGKPVALFGSYGWGDGEWMRTWEQDCLAAGAKLIAESVICCEAPDDDALAACRALGKAAAAV